MGDRYNGMIQCPYCLKQTEFYYAESCGFTRERCEHCKKLFDIRMSITFVGVKIRRKKKKGDEK